MKFNPLIDYQFGDITFIQTCLACPEMYDVYKGETKVGWLRLRYSTLRFKLYDKDKTILYKKLIGDESDMIGQFKNEADRMYYLNDVVTTIMEKI